MKHHRRARSSLVAIAAAAVAIAVAALSAGQSRQDETVAIGSPPSGTAVSDPVSTGSQPVGDDTSYSITQLVTNDSSQTLSLTGSVADNGGTITQSEPTIDPHTTQVYQATNVNNGVQLTLQFSATQGGTFKVDTDVPRRQDNWTNATVNGFGLGLDKISLGSHDNPQANIVIKDCTQSCTPYLSSSAFASEPS